MNGDGGTLWTIVQNGGIIGVFFIALWGVVRGWWVPRWVFDMVVKDRDEWKKTAVEGVAVGDRGAAVAEKVVDSALSDRERLQRIEDQIRRMGGGL